MWYGWRTFLWRFKCSIGHKEFRSPYKAPKHHRSDNRIHHDTVSSCNGTGTYRAEILQKTAYTLNNLFTNKGFNKQIFTADRMSCNMLKLAAKFGCISDLAYISKYFYITSRYREALSVIELTKKVGTSWSGVQQACRPREVYWGCGGGGAVLVAED